MLIDAPQRNALADRFEAFARAVGKPDDEVAAERERAYNGPVLVAWIVRLTDEVPEVPRHEQWMSAGGALTNFLTALHLMGFGAKTLAGRKCTHPSVRDAFCEEGEQLAAFICIGTPTRAPQPRDVDDPGAALSRWNEA